MSDKKINRTFLDGSSRKVIIGEEPVLYRLRFLRKKYNITQSDMADRLNVSKQYYSQIERGIHHLTYNDARSLARALNMTTDELFEEDFKKQKRYGHRK